jgi:thymidylate synthase
MKHVKINAFDIPDSWFKTLNAIWTQGEIFNVGHGSEETDTKKLDITIEIEHPEHRPLVDDKAPCDMKYILGYALEYLWSGEASEGEVYTYGSRLNKPINQPEHIINAILENPNNRQLTMVIRVPEDAIMYRYTTEMVDFLPVIVKKKHEPPCLSIIDIEVLNGKINMTFYFRSWDAYAGLPANIAGLFLFMESFVKEINERGNKDYNTGKMIFHSKNCHIYKRQYTLVEELVNPKEKKATGFSEEDLKKLKKKLAKTLNDYNHEKASGMKTQKFPF